MTSEQQAVEEIPDQVAKQPEGEPPAAPSEPRHNARPMHNGPNLTPRAIAKAEVFVEGDHVVYPTHGVGNVQRVGSEDIAGDKLELIHNTVYEDTIPMQGC